MSRTVREHVVSAAGKSNSARSAVQSRTQSQALGTTPAAKGAPTRSSAAAKALTGKAITGKALAEKAKPAPTVISTKAPAAKRTVKPRASAAATKLPATIAESPKSRTRAAAPAKSAESTKAPARTVAKATASAAAATRAAKAPPKPLPLSERPIDQVWREYRTSPTTEVRNFLIARHLDLVAYAAERLHKRLPSEVEINDLKSAGAFGLMDAVDSFDPDRGVKFETYCTQRIRGAMFDELRSMDWVPRLVRSRTAKVEKVRKSIEMETGSRPTEDEVAKRLNVSGDEFEKLQKDSRPISMVSLTRKCFETDSSKDVREIDVVEDGRQENPLQAVQKQDLQDRIKKGLNRAERLIVILYYYEEMTMKEIGATLDLSESRVSQMHSSILARLKAQMQSPETVEE